jgi:hypothetical protein
VAITVNGVTGSVTDVEWAQMWQDAMEGRRAESVATGLQVTPSTGRVLAVSAGRSFQAGASVVYTGGSTVTLAANTASAPRIDTVCMQVNWAGTETTAGAATITAGNIVDARPGVNDGVLTSVTLGGQWAQGNPQLGLIRIGAVVELAGRITLTGSVQTVGNVSTFAGASLLPPGFRPRRTAAQVMATGESAASPSQHKLLFLADGTCTCTTLSGSLPTGESMRVMTTHWFGE